jgi:acylglycerol lipase
MFLKSFHLSLIPVILFFSVTTAANNLAQHIHKTFTITTNDGLSLFGQSWEPADSIVGVVCLFHGHGEHIGRYATFAAAMNDAGFAVMGFDLRGHGKSGGLRGHVPGYEQMMDDCSLILTETMRHYPKKVVFLYGHSMGGNLVINYALRRKPQIAGVIASSPQLRTSFPVPAWKLFVGRMLYNIWPTLTLSDGIDRNALCRSPQVLSSLKTDPLIHDRVTARYLCIMDAGEWAIKHASELTNEMLVMHGDSDRVTSADASRQFAVKTSHCSLKIWPGYYHKLYEEPGKEDVFKYTIAWMRGRLNR